MINAADAFRLITDWSVLWLVHHLDRCANDDADVFVLIAVTNWINSGMIGSPGDGCDNDNADAFMLNTRISAHLSYDWHSWRQVSICTMRLARADGLTLRRRRQYLQGILTAKTKKDRSMGMDSEREIRSHWTVVFK